MKAVLESIHSVLSGDVNLVSLLGGSSKIRRSRQGREVEAACVTLAEISEKRFVEGTDRIRETEAQVCAWAGGDRACSDVCEAVIAALDDVDLTRRFALIVGSEGRGVSEKLRAGAFDLRIPTAGVESLNVAMTAGIILYEARRQRMLRQ